MGAGLSHVTGRAHHRFELRAAPLALLVLVGGGLHVLTPQQRLLEGVLVAQLGEVAAANRFVLADCLEPLELVHDVVE
jgi:hypothetical protein